MRTWELPGNSLYPILVPRHWYCREQERRHFVELGGTKGQIHLCGQRMGVVFRGLGWRLTLRLKQPSYYGSHCRWWRLQQKLPYPPPHPPHILVPSLRERDLCRCSKLKSAAIALQTSVEESRTQSKGSLFKLHWVSADSKSGLRSLN